MFAFSRAFLSGLAVVLALTLALVATGFAHHTPTADDAAKTAFLLAGGTAADLCDDMGDDLGGSGDCPVCHLTATAVLPAADLPLLQAALEFERVVVAPRENRAARMVRDPARGMRAPPSA